MFRELNTLLTNQRLPRKEPKNLSWQGAISQFIFVTVPVCVSRPVFTLDISVDFRLLQQYVWMWLNTELYNGTDYL